MCLLALQAAAYYKGEPYPLDVLGAESEGMIGYLLEQSFNSYCRSHRVMSDNGSRSLVSQVMTGSGKPGFISWMHRSSL